MADKSYTQEIIDRVVGYALAAARASQQGETSIRLGAGPSAQDLLLKRGGYCARFVRQVYETACDFGEYRWKHGARTALGMCDGLAAEGHEVTDHSLIPGDIVGINRHSGPYGHVAIYVGKIEGKDIIAENTSSGSRGDPRRPGTKLTPYADIAHRVTGVYRLLDGVPKPMWPAFRAFVYVGSNCREIVLAPNGDHRKDQGKTYWRFK